MVKESQTRFVSPKAWNRIEQWSRRKPVFALMGEFSAGKSTLMNFLLRKQALPTQVTATQLPPIWFSWGDGSAYVKRHDGSSYDITLDQLDQVGVNDAQFIRIFMKADILEAVDLIDTPGISDPKISTDVWRRAVGQANGVLWCTHSTQAWRETERATWAALPERLQHRSLLLITRADALGQKDRQKVLRRVNREAGHLFNRSILFSARDAIVARDKTGDAELWSRSGGGKMVDSFLAITEQIMDSRADQLSRYQIDKSLSEGVRVRPEAAEQSAETVEEHEPLKLSDVVENTAAETEENVVTSFPVRPSRVERRSEDTDRTRIDAKEAERMRAEMDAPKDDLRALFSDTPSDPLDLRTLADPAKDVDEFTFLDEEPEDEAEAELVVIAADDEEEADETPVELSEPAADEAVAADKEDDAAPTDIERSVSSITALLSEQSDSQDGDYEPEPESNSLMPVEDALYDASVIEKPVLVARQDDHDDESAPLSAAAMWNEIVTKETLPDDAQGLRSAFAAFLTEFDQIALERRAEQKGDSLRPVPKTGESGRAEWHVL